MNKRIIHVEIEAQIEDNLMGKAYGVKDIQQHMNLFNEIHGDCMRVRIISYEEKK